MKKFFLFIFLFLSILSVTFYYSFIVHTSNSVVEDSFVINSPYLAVVKSLAGKESLEKMVEENDGVLKKHWQNFIIEVPKRVLKIKEYKLEGTLYFSIEKHDKNLGYLNLPFEQDIKIDKDIFTIKTNLKEPQKNIKVYNKIIEIFPSKNDPFKTSVIIKSELKISKFIPFFFKDFMDKRVIESNKKDLDNLINNLKGISQKKFNFK